MTAGRGQSGVNGRRGTMDNSGDKTGKKTDALTLGAIGENITLCRYVDEGCRPVARNWRAGRVAEIDIIVFDEKEDTLVICEVKTRTASRSHRGGAPERRQAPQQIIAPGRMPASDRAPAAAGDQAPEATRAATFEASDSVDRRKQAKNILAARRFLEKHPEYAEKNVRFDVAEVYNIGGAYEVSITKDAF